MKTILLDTSIDYTSWDINEAGSIQMTEWQDISTAPKPPDNWQEDLPSFLVWDGKEIYCVETNLYAKDNGCGCCSSEIKATHWMPLPPPPKKGDE